MTRRLARLWGIDVIGNQAVRQNQRPSGDNEVRVVEIAAIGHLAIRIEFENVRPARRIIEMLRGDTAQGVTRHDRVSGSRAFVF